MFKIGLPSNADCRLKAPVKISVDYGKAHVIGLVIGVLFLGPVVYFIWSINWDNSTIFHIFDADSTTFLTSLAFVLVAHEMCHVLSHPRFGLSSDSIVGFDPSIFVPYAEYNGVINKRRLTSILFMPFIILSISMFPLTWLFPQFISQFAWCSILNAASSGGDAYLLWFVFRTIPKDSLIQGHRYGFELEI